MSVLTRCFRTTIQKIPACINWLITFAFLNVTWTMFRADTISDAMSLVGKIFDFQWGAVTEDICSGFRLEEFMTIMGLLRCSTINDRHPAFWMVVFLVIAFLLIFGKNSIERTRCLTLNAVRAFETAFLLVWCIFSFAGVTKFIYFNF